MTKQFYKEKYPHLFEPMVVGKKKDVYKNRILLAPMASISSAGGAEANGRINDYGVDFYTNFARGGFASICVPIEIPKNGGHANAFSLDAEVMGFMSMHFLQRSVHAYGTKSSCEIYHAGCCMLPGPGRTIMSASAFVYNGNQVKEMNEEDMEDVIKMYVDAAILTKRANFDSILLHYGHGWLMNNFLSPLINHRTDKYGGSVENRCRFPRMVIERIRKAIGDDLTIELRLNGSDMMEGGIVPEDAAQQALIFEDIVDMIHITCGTRLDASSRPKMHPTHFMEPAHNAAAAEIIKKAGVKIPIGLVGSIQDPELAERLLAEGKADYVVVARQAIADNNWVNKIREGRLDDIRPCLRCDYCLDGGRRGALTKEVRIQDDATFDRRCAVDPLGCQGLAKRRFPAPERSKKVAVIGGGIAGMQAALTAAERGHKVVLYEKSDKLGGQALLSDVMWFKKEMKAFHEYLERQVKKAGVIVLMNTSATPELIEEADFDVVIVAVGAEQVIPPIPGLDNAIMAFDVFGHEDKLGKKVAIVGGGSVGCELSIHLAGLGHEVVVVEMGSFLCASAQISERMHTMEYMEKNNVKSYIETKCVEITDKGIFIENESGKQFIEADSIVIAAGTRCMVEERDKFQNAAFDVINVGDCIKASDIVNAVETGWNAGATI
ncbi:NAD(P)/FAD-dependent oxidoreductase [Pelotomaculum propionicicum]|uniref:NADH oxidase n=1 Tax=Pelotomaculum propionicicum TaxID=258475 RepID=A0A4Y7RS39_9FIRM|nr:NAD(P)/FAD-dependent oxidoreductase [Pelotomaculum propionicicum]TEB11693.1 NADH oxidase [Pelotomaculum propionicicum]